MKPDGKAPDGKPRWFLSTAISALAERERLTGRPSTRTPPERFDPKLEREILEIERTGSEVDSLLARLRGGAERRAPPRDDRAGRREVHRPRTSGPWFRRSGPAARRPCVASMSREMLRAALSEVAALCQWRVDAEAA